MIPGLLVFAIGLTVLPSPAATGGEEAGQVAERFARVLNDRRPADLQEILPRSGKILISIPDAGRTAGYYGNSQVEALFTGYLAGTTFRDCRIDHIEVQDGSYARIDLTANRTGPDGEPAAVVYRLALQPEQGRWVLREIRESTR